MIIELAGAIVQEIVVSVATTKLGKLRQHVFGDPERKAWQDVAEQAVAATRRRIDTAEAEYLRIDLFAPATGRELARLLTLNDQPSAERIVRSAGLQKEEERDCFAKVVDLFLEELHQALSANPTLRDHATARVTRAIDTRTGAMYESVKKIEASVGAQRPAPRLSTLPSRAKVFVGRRSDIDRLVAALTTSGRAAISAVGGMGGIGKTSLALEVAHAVAEHFPDGTLFINLQGQAASPVSTYNAMVGLIRQIEPGSGQLPGTVDELTPLYRRMLAGKRMLLLLDNAKDAAQVEPLLPPEPVAILISSRNLIDTSGVSSHKVDLLSENDGIIFIQAIIDHVRPMSDRQIRSIVLFCDGLPIAIEAAGRFLREHQTWSVEEYLSELGSNRWNALPNVDRVLKFSVERLENERPEIHPKWIALGIFSSEFDRSAAAAVWQTDKRAARVILDQLYERSLVLFDSNTNRFRLHDLFRELAMSALSGDIGSAVEENYAAYYLNIIHIARQKYHDSGSGQMSGLELFDREQAEILNAQRRISRPPHTLRRDQILAEFPNRIQDMVPLRLSNLSQIEWYIDQFRAGKRMSNLECMGAAIGNLAGTLTRRGRLDWAFKSHACARMISRRINSSLHEAQDLLGMAVLARRLGKPRDAINYMLEARTLHPDLFVEVVLLEWHMNIGNMRKDDRDFIGALSDLRIALTLARELRRPYQLSGALWNLADLRYLMGFPQEAIAFGTESLRLKRRVNDPWLPNAEQQFLRWGGDLNDV